MDRYEVPIDAHLAPLVEAAERGDEVVITAAGRVVARLEPESKGQNADDGGDDHCLRELSKLLQDLPSAETKEAGRLIREMRDEERF